MVYVIGFITIYIIGIFIFDQILSYLSAKGADGEARKYAMVNWGLSLSNGTLSLLVILGFWFLGGFAWADDIIRSWEFHPIITGVLFVLTLTVLGKPLEIVESIARTIGSEEAFGFNRTTIKTFIKDFFKEGIVIYITIIIVMAVVFSVFHYGGNWASVYVVIAITILTFVIDYIYPTLIAPFLNKLTPLPEGELLDEIKKYTERVGYKLSGIYTDDSSKRTTKPNAYFMGFGNNKKIVLNDTLDNYTNSEIISVLAHEVGHDKNRHVLKETCLSVIFLAIEFLLLGLFIHTELMAEFLFVNKASAWVGIVAFGMIWAPFGYIISWIKNIISRKYEYEADAYAVKTVDNFEAAITCEQKLSNDHLSNENPHWLWVSIKYSHPPTRDRISAMYKVKESLEIDNF